MNSTAETQRTETLMKEIDLVQNCISRMAQYSFIVKGWTISLVAALLALTPQKTNIRLLCIVCFVLTVCFWYLDATFLKTEKLYRRKYKWIIANRGITSEFSFDLDPNNEKMWIDEDQKNGKLSILSVMFTKSMVPIYGSLALLTFAGMVLAFCGIRIK